jgi:hypothetical protein
MFNTTITIFDYVKGCYLGLDLREEDENLSHKMK